MALTATVHHVEVALSDVDRGVYESLDLRLARHPSETMRYLVTRLLAYCLSYEDGIAFSKGGLSSTDDPPIAIFDPTGILLVWIDIGSPSAERLHKAAKAARKVVLYTSADLALLRREAASQRVHALETIDVFRFEPVFVDAIADKLERRSKLEITRNDGQLYVGVDGTTLEAGIARASLVEE